MCGIFCLISQLSKNNRYQIFEQFKEFIDRRGPNSNGYKEITVNNFNIFCYSSVLWLQGENITHQPLESDNSILLYNGDIFGGEKFDDSRDIKGDTQLVLNLIKDSTTTCLIENLYNMQGPYAFIYIDLKRGILYFGRDPFGRRSLLIGRNQDEIILSSVAKRHTDYNFIEYPSIGIISVDLNIGKWTLFPWKHRYDDFHKQYENLVEFIGHSIDIEPSLELNRQIFKEPQIDDLRLFQQKYEINNSELFNFLLDDQTWLGRVKYLKDLLMLSVKKRILSQPKFCRNCYNRRDCDHNMIGILFSGGVDCAILAFLVHEILPIDQTIDLINVSFDCANNFKSPDRLTGLATFQELQNCCKGRKWNFVEVNVTKDELNQIRNDRIADLIYPLKTVLDDSLGSALWFAARGQSDNYISPCRVLLVGMGADELFGGYTKHRAALQKNGWKGLYDCLESDWENLPYRNLARDDRVVGDHGRQLRTPYLDEDLVNYIRNLEPWQKTWPVGEQLESVGEKILLRSLAYYLGLEKTARLKKRALQFGSRIANSKEKAHEISKNLV